VGGRARAGRGPSRVTASGGVARVRVPASSANVGAGYDCIGFAVDRWLTGSVGAQGESHDGKSEVKMRRRGTVASLNVDPPDDAVVAGFLAACAARGKPAPARLDF